MATGNDDDIVIPLPETSASHSRQALDYLTLVRKMLHLQHCSQSMHLQLVWRPRPELFRAMNFCNDHLST